MMKELGRLGKWLIWLTLLMVIVSAVFSALLDVPGGIDNLAAVAADTQGKSWIAQYDGNKINFSQIDSNGYLLQEFSVSRTTDGLTAIVADMSTDEEGNLYFIRHYAGLSDGRSSDRQELSVYKSGFVPFVRLKTVRLDTDELVGIRYLGVTVSTSVVLTGVNQDSTELIRTAIDLDTLKKGGVSIKQTRTYPTLPAEGVYKVAAVGTDTAYLSKSGKIFLSKEGTSSPTELYPNEDGSYAYASFISEGAASSQIVIGSQRDGGILRVYTDNGRWEYIIEGGHGMGDISYTGRDVAELHTPPGEDVNFTAVVSSKVSGMSELVVCQYGSYFVVSNVRYGFFKLFWKCAGRVLFFALAFLILLLIIWGLKRYIKGSRTIFVKLIFASIPLMILALGLFGTYSYYTYSGALDDTYKTKVADQGSLLRALFTSESYDKITSPSRYTSKEYEYLKLQMGTRDVYTSSAYYVDGALFTGVDRNLPCLFPFGIHTSKSVHDIYLKAARSGKQQTGIIDDALGERIICVNPAGSSSGNTEFLL